MQVAKLGMAINRKWTQNGEQRESTCFVDMTAFGRQAEILNQYVGKGSPLFVEGRLEYSTWEGQEGGKRSKLEVIIENFQFVGAPRSAGEGGARRPAAGAGGSGSGGSGSGGKGKAPAAEGQAEAGGDVDYGDIPF
jgi:single-strand DNA-binding protein